MSLDANLFQNTPKLQIMAFYRNSIKNVGAVLFSNLNELKKIDFGTNTCINILAQTPEEFENLKAQLIEKCPPLEATEEYQKATVTSATDE